MVDKQLTFNELPEAVQVLGQKIDELTLLLSSITEQSQSKADRWLSIEELADYLPGRPAITTLYGRVQRREIPHKRVGKRLVFLQSEIDEYINSKSVKTSTEIAAIAISHPTRVRRGGRRAA